MAIDWKSCAAVETVSGRLSGQPVIRGTRVQPEDLVVNRAGGAAWLIENFGVPAETVQTVLAFHDRHSMARAPNLA
jgi:uncharacterized protein (DUF433 family)